jgi:aminoglycoside phosphotransferase (APT) family kinase protein
MLRGGAAITGVVPLSIGHSNETYLIEGLDRILRMPPCEEGLLPPYDMARQHAVLAAVGASTDGPPVPRVFELCTNPSVLGDPFFIMERVPGEAFEYELPEWLGAAPAELASRMCAQWMAAVAAVHRFPAARMPTPSLTVAEEAAHWRDVAAEADAPPALLDLLDDLVRRPPATSGPPTSVHGDPKPANCLWDRGRLVALLDWEMAHVGEPLTDLGYLSSFYALHQEATATAGFDLPGWWSHSQVISAWEQATGRVACDITRYEVLGMGKICAIIGLGYHLFRTGQASDPRFAAWGDVLPGYVDLARRHAT